MGKQMIRPKSLKKGSLLIGTDPNGHERPYIVVNIDKEHARLRSLDESDHFQETPWMDFKWKPNWSDMRRITKKQVEKFFQERYTKYIERRESIIRPRGITH